MAGECNDSLQIQEAGQEISFYPRLIYLLAWISHFFSSPSIVKSFETVQFLLHALDQHNHREFTGLFHTASTIELWYIAPRTEELKCINLLVFIGIQPFPIRYCNFSLHARYAAVRAGWGWKMLLTFKNHASYI